MNQDSASKFAATQNIIRNKFKKAYKNRIKNEHDVSHAMKPITTAITDDLKSNKSDHSKTTNTPELQLGAKNNSSHLKKKSEDPNTLCDILRMLLTSGQNDSEINDILNELRDLDIII